MRDKCANLPLWDRLKLLNMIFTSSCIWSVEPPPSTAVFGVHGFKSSGRINETGEDSAVCLNNPSVLLPPLLLPFLLPLPSLMQVFFLDLYAYLKILKKSAVKWQWTWTTLTRKEGSKLYPQEKHCRKQPSGTKPSSDLGESLGVFRAGSLLWFPLYKWPMHITGIQPQRAVLRIIGKQ